MIQEKTLIHTEKDIIGIRKAAQAAAFVREELKILIQPGMTTKEIDIMAARLIEAADGTSAFLGYHGFPGYICISLNDEVVHGIGTETRHVIDGDLISLDIGVNLDGYIGDNAETIIIGAPANESAVHLVDNTKLALNAGIKAAVKGNFIRDIGAAVQDVAEKANLAIVREYVGHGCGIQLHEPPEIPNYRTKDKGPKLKNGMVLAIEPMLNLGTEKVKTDNDGWTVRTCDASLSAHFEHMVLINDNKPEILTWPIKVK